MVEMKSESAVLRHPQGEIVSGPAADFWMKGEATIPLSELAPQPSADRSAEERDWHSPRPCRASS